jgi:RHS repeat-associated protein
MGGATTTYSYDALGNLMGAWLPDGRTIEYVVDGLNRRVGKKVNGTLTEGFLYEGQLRPVAWLDGASNVYARFVYGTRVNVPEYMVTAEGTFRILTDHLGSPRLVVNASTGAVAQRVDYDEWGGVLADSAPGFQPFGFAGGLYDRDTGLVRFGARDYDPSVGRWTAKDPIRFGGGMNLYAYVDSDPVNGTDPFGLESYTCRTPLHAFGGTGTRSGPDVRGNPFYHQYSCVVRDGNAQCGGQDRTGSAAGSPGKASDDRFNKDNCKQTRPDDDCYEQCLTGEWAKPRPWYGIPFGTDCQEYDDDVNARCRKQCG